MSLHAYIDAIGVIGPGASSWPEWRAALCNNGEHPDLKTVIPALNVLPSAERRRIGSGVKIALASGLEALAAAETDPASITTVFSSSGGDGENCHWICEALTSAERLISPTRFHNSVHNAPSGYWGIASGAMLPSTSIGAFDASFSAGLLEAAVQCAVGNVPVLLVAYDTPYPEPLNSARPIADQFAVSVLLTPAPGARSLAGIALTIGSAAPSVMQDRVLESLRLGIPAARSLPLLQALARLPDAASDVVPSDVHLEYLHGQSLTVAFVPVRNNV
jgi:hypothetical protein